MALTAEWAGGECLQTTTTSSGDEGSQFSLAGAQTVWARETTIVAGNWSAASYLKDHPSLPGPAQASVRSNNAVVGNLAKQGCTFAMYVDTTTLLCFMWFLQTAPGANSYPSYLGITSGGGIALYDKISTVLATASGVFTAATWAYLRVTIEHNAGAGTARWRVWKWSTADPRSGDWGSPIMDYSQAADIGAAIVFTSIDDTASLFGSTAKHYLDDMFCFSFTDDVDLPPAPAMVYRCVPDGTGNSADFTSGSGTNPDYQDVDDAVCDQDTTYDQSLTTFTPELQLYTLTASPTIPSGYTVYVEAIIGAAAASAAAARQVLVRENATTTQVGINFATTATYAAFSRMMMTTPSSAAVWTQTLIDGLEVGAQNNSVLRPLKLSQVFALIVGIPPLTTTFAQQPALMGMSGGII